MTDLRVFQESLYSRLVMSPAETVRLFEHGLILALQVLHPGKNLPHFQITLRNYPSYTDIRALSADQVNRLVAIRGIVISAAKPRIKASTLTIMCSNCYAQQTIKSTSGFGSTMLPRHCTSRPAEAGGRACPMDPFIISPDDSEYINTQTMKLQEAPEMVPTGEMPRHIVLAAENSLVGRVKPGSRVTIIGAHATFSPKINSGASSKAARGVGDVGIRVPYLRVLGVQSDSGASDIALGRITPQEEDEIRRVVATTPNISDTIAESIAPAIMGRTDIKKAIACSLFGGCRKALPDGMTLRGDINVLLLGDPSVAKSQFLKFASQVAPISVYTSGKGSSAAGLTASVLRDASTGEFHLEGGALVLADGGLVCIDEFDKMREQDRVAIHEAMEQQTISIAKAGITTILNSRTSIIAAANPVYGRYDDMKSASENIEFQATILSRFDLIFIIRDLQDEEMDRALATHIIGVHRRVDATSRDLAGKDLIDIPLLKKLIAFSRRLQPRLSEEGAALLRSRYVRFRQDMAESRRKEVAAAHSKSKFDSSGSAQVIPITVRQLEAIIRISESLARMELLEEAETRHVEEALRLFKVATLQAASSPYGDTMGLRNGPAFEAKIRSCESFILTRVPLNTSISTRQLLRELITHGHDEVAAKRALDLLVQRSCFTYERERKSVRRMTAEGAR